MQVGKIETVAAIDVGSNLLRMMIAQITSDGETIPLEDLWEPTHIGRDTFSFGRVQVDSVQETCDILKGFSKLMQDYKVRHYRAVTTSGIREAENQEYVLEQIRIKTGLVVEVINNAQERFLMYKAIRDYFHDYRKSRDKGTLIVDIGSGGVETSVYSDGSLKFTEYIKIGSLRLREILADLEQLTLDFPSIMEEFIESRIDFLRQRIRKIQINNFIGLGGELRSIINLCMDVEEKFIKKSVLEKLYKKVHSMTTEQIVNEFNLQRNQAGILLPSIIILYRFLDMTDAEGIDTPMSSLRHGLISDMADEWFDTTARKDFLNDIISSVWYIGSKYSIDKVHCLNIEKLVLSIFDQTTKIHRMGERERFYLQIAAILHDVGKHVNLNQHDIHSYNIIRFQDIMGFSNEELNLVANIARYHSEETPHPSHDNFKVLGTRERITVSKLAAILKLAEALDISHKQKFDDIEISVSGKELFFRVQHDEDMLLEEWNFAHNAFFFEEVMGIRPVLKRRR